MLNGKPLALPPAWIWGPLPMSQGPTRETLAGAHQLHYAAQEQGNGPVPIISVLSGSVRRSTLLMELIFKILTNLLTFKLTWTV